MNCYSKKLFVAMLFCYNILLCMQPTRQELAILDGLVTLDSQARPTFNENEIYKRMSPYRNARIKAIRNSFEAYSLRSSDSVFSKRKNYESWQSTATSSSSSYESTSEELSDRTSENSIYSSESSSSSTTEELLSNLTKTKSEIKEDKQTITQLQAKLTTSNTKLDKANKKIIAPQQQVDAQQNKTPNNQITTQQELKEMRLAKQQLFHYYGATTELQLARKLCDACHFTKQSQVTSQINKTYFFSFCCICKTINIFHKEDQPNAGQFTCNQKRCVTKIRQ